MKNSKHQGSAILIVIIVIAVVALALSLFYILNSKKTVNAPNSTTTTSSTSSTGSPVTTNAVMIKDMAFSPDNVTVKVGTTITWTNEDSTVHTVTANDGSFASDSLANGKSYSHTFTTPGTYKYRCVIHPNMTGIITVTQ